MEIFELTENDLKQLKIISAAISKESYLLGFISGLISTYIEENGNDIYLSEFLNCLNIETSKLYELMRLENL